MHTQEMPLGVQLPGAFLLVVGRHGGGRTHVLHCPAARRLLGITQWGGGGIKLLSKSSRGRRTQQECTTKWLRASFPLYRKSFPTMRISPGLVRSFRPYKSLFCIRLYRILTGAELSSMFSPTWLSNNSFETTWLFGLRVMLMPVDQPDISQSAIVTFLAFSIAMPVPLPPPPDGVSVAVQMHVV